MTRGASYLRKRQCASRHSLSLQHVTETLILRRAIPCGEVEQALDHVRLLGPGDRMPSGHDEAGHAVDAEPVGAEIVGVDGVDVLLAAQEGAGGDRVEAAGP